jgi:putative transcriptional regulator
MKKKDIIIKVRTLPDGTAVQVMPDGSTQPLQDKTDWNRLRNMTEEEIEAAAASDADNPASSKEELKRFKSIPNIKELRKALDMTQEEFAKSFSLPLGSVRDWEQGSRQPDSAARVLLQVIAKNPKAVLEALRGR